MKANELAYHILVLKRLYAIAKAKQGMFLDEPIKERSLRDGINAMRVAIEYLETEWRKLT